MRASHRRILLGIGAAAIVGGLVWAVPYVHRLISIYRHTKISAQRAPAAEQDWKKEFGGLVDETLARSPKREDSDSAVRLIALAKSAGIDMRRPERKEAYRRERDPDEVARKAVHEYADAEAKGTGGPIVSPPVAVEKYLDSHEEALAAIVEHLSRNGPFAWKSDLALGPDAPIPNLLGQIRLQRLLAARALTRAAAGNPEEAERTLAASWTLNESLRDRPEVISQLIAISVARSQVALLRRLAVDPVAWRERLSEHDYRTSMLAALAVENDGTVRRLAPASSAFDRAMIADLLDAHRAFLTILRDAPVGDRSLSEAAMPRENPDSAGSIIASIALPNVVDAMRRAHRLILDTELTDRVLQARTLEARLGHWPAEMPEIGPSRMPGARWIYVLDEGGRPTISFSRELHWESLSGLVLPMSYQPG